MKIKTLLSISASFFTLASQAQIHPASMWMNTFQFNATNHVHENWAASGYNVYDINMVKDVNGYITGIQTSTTGLMSGSVDQYISTGSRNATTNVFTASTQKKLHGTTTFLNWRNETWMGDGTKDTVIMWQDSINGAWTNVIKHVIHYSTGTTIDLITDYNWSVPTTAWVPATKTAITYSGSNYSIMNQFVWTAATSTWTPNGSIQYYWSSNKLDSVWLTDASAILQQRVFTLADGSGKTKSLSALNWDAGTSKWKAGVSMTFDNSLSAVNEIASSNKETMKVYPNPADQILKIDFENTKNVKIYINNIVGKEVYSNELRNYHSEINTSELINGIYFISIEVEGKIIEQQKLIIAH